MWFTLCIATLFATTLGSSFELTTGQTEGIPHENLTTTECITSSDLLITAGRISATKIWVPMACHEMMPKCTYQEFNDECPQLTDAPLTEDLNTTLRWHHPVGTLYGARPEYAVEYSVRLDHTKMPDENIVLTWTRKDCESNFKYLLDTCYNGTGSFPGRLTVGPLKGTVFELKIVPHDCNLGSAPSTSAIS